MTVHGLYPGYILIDYHSDKAPHKMTVPTRAWDAFAGTEGQGGYEAWDTTNVDAVGMVEDLATQLSLNCSAEVVFDKWTIYTLDTPTSPPLPRGGGVFTDLHGVNGSPGWFYGVQLTLTYYDTVFEEAKLVLLDAASLNSFQPRAVGALTSQLAALNAAFTTDTSAWSSRTGNRPAVLRSCRFTLNNKLQKEYYG